MSTTTHLKVIENDAEYETAMERLGEIWEAEEGTAEFDELGVLGLLISNYEEQLFPIEEPDPIEAIKFYMEQNGIKKSEFAKLVKSRSRASEFFNRKRDLSLPQIRLISKTWNISADVLIQPVSAD